MRAIDDASMSPIRRTRSWIRMSMTGSLAALVELAPLAPRFLPAMLLMAVAGCAAGAQGQTSKPRPTTGKASARASSDSRGDLGSAAGAHGGQAGHVHRQGRIPAGLTARQVDQIHKALRSGRCDDAMDALAILAAKPVLARRWQNDILGLLAGPLPDHHPLLRTRALLALAGSGKGAAPALASALSDMSPTKARKTLSALLASARNNDQARQFLNEVAKAAAAKGMVSPLATALVDLGAGASNLAGWLPQSVVQAAVETARGRSRSSRGPLRDRLQAASTLIALGEKPTSLLFVAQAALAKQPRSASRPTMRAAGAGHAASHAASRTAGQTAPATSTDRILAFQIVARACAKPQAAPARWQPSAPCLALLKGTLLQAARRGRPAEERRAALAAIWAMGPMLDDPAVSKLALHLASDKNPEFRSWPLCAALASNPGRPAGRVARGIARRLAKDPSPQVRLRARILLSGPTNTNVEAICPVRLDLAHTP